MNISRHILFFILSLAGFSISAQESIFIDVSSPVYQINGDFLLSKGLTGKGVKVGVIDVGFEKLSTNKCLRHITDSSRLHFARNYLYRVLNTGDSLQQLLLQGIAASEIPLFPQPWPEDCDLCDTVTLFNMMNTHGSFVTFMIAGNLKFYKISGLGRDADFYLAKTEFGKRDHRLEENLLNQALSDFYGKGVRLVNMSLGYRDNFEPESLNYTPDQMNGHTAYSSQACNKWSSEGMILVVAAGNSGLKQWKRISAPGEAEGCITVGATEKLNSLLKAGYSSIGDYDYGYVKPDVVCYSESGTSMAAPVITGLIAAMLQKKPDLSAGKIKEILHKSSTIYPYPNDFVGYGIPDSKKIFDLLQNDTLTVSSAQLVETSDNKVEIETYSNFTVDCFDKSDAYHVVNQYNPEIRKEKIKIKRKSGVARTTVVINLTAVYEIIWNLK